MVVQHNIPALNSYRNLGINNSNLAKNLEKLSSGYRINRAADDAAGLAISEKMRGQIRGLGMAEQNAENGISLIQTAEGGLNETHDILQRMRELAVQSSNGTYQDEDRKQIELEYQALKQEIDRIASYTNYNGIKLLDGTVGGVNLSNASAFSAGATAGDPAYDAAMAELVANNTTYDSTAASNTVIDATHTVVGWGSDYAGDPAVDLSDCTQMYSNATIVVNGTAGTDVNLTHYINPADATTGATANLGAKLGVTGTGNIQVTAASGAYATAGTWNIAADALQISYNRDNGGTGWTVTLHDSTTGTTPISGGAVTLSGAVGTDGKVKLYAPGAETGGSDYIELDLSGMFTGGQPGEVDASIDNVTFSYSAALSVGANGAAGTAATFAGTATTVIRGETVTPDNPFEVGDKLNVGVDIAVADDGTYTVSVSAEALATDAAHAEELAEIFDLENGVYDATQQAIIFNSKDGDADKALRIDLRSDDLGANTTGAGSNVGVAPLSANAFNEAGLAAHAGKVVSFNMEVALEDGTGAMPVAAAAISITDKTADANANSVSIGTVDQAAVDAAMTNMQNAASTPDAERANNMLAAMGISYSSTFEVNKDLETSGNTDDLALYNSLNGKDAYIITRDSTKDEHRNLYNAPSEFETILQVNGKSYHGTLEDGDMVFKTDDGTVVATLSDATLAKETGTVRFNTGDQNAVVGYESQLVKKEGAQIGSENQAELVFQIGANGTEDQRVGMYVLNMSSDNLGNHAKGNFVSDSSIATLDQANMAVETLDHAINYVSSQRANLGALQNRLEHTLNNLGVTKENLTAAESSIRDTDMAEEMMEFTKNNILSQASQAMLAQANQLPQGVLQLLG